MAAWFISTNMVEAHMARRFRAFCFVSTKMKNGKVEGLHFLRVGMKSYRAFLQLWAKWLQDEL